MTDEPLIYLMTRRDDPDLDQPGFGFVQYDSTTEPHEHNPALFNDPRFYASPSLYGCSSPRLPCLYPSHCSTPSKNLHIAIPGCQHR